MDDTHFFSETDVVYTPCDNDSDVIHDQEPVVVGYSHVNEGTARDRKTIYPSNQSSIIPSVLELTRSEASVTENHPYLESDEPTPKEPKYLANDNIISNVNVDYDYSPNFGSEKSFVYPTEEDFKGKSAQSMTQSSIDSFHTAKDYMDTNSDSVFSALKYLRGIDQDSTNRSRQLTSSDTQSFYTASQGLTDSHHGSHSSESSLFGHFAYNYLDWSSGRQSLDVESLTEKSSRNDSKRSSLGSHTSEASMHTLDTIRLGGMIGGILTHLGNNPFH